MTTQGERLKKIRTELNFSQEEMGKIFNSTKSYISLIERDKCNFSVPQMLKLINDYNVNINYLLAGKGAPFLQKNDAALKRDILFQVNKILTERGF